MTLITLFAVANTALVNYITSSRLIYGMAHHGLLPKDVGAVHPKTQTPHIAIAILFVVLAGLALVGTIGDLASATVLMLLTVFCIVNGALFVLKRRPGEPEGSFELPAWVPLAGAVTCGVLILFRAASGDWKAPAIAAGLLAGIMALYAVLKPKAVIEA